ncbi:MAG TPA: hypothetical protein VG694_01055 [Candidatus Paceibacterota bacterium]|jgi:hypothetical protein|nr:hypothetical protein [Candidatus Paceibacterota bacterium]
MGMDKMPKKGFDSKEVKSINTGPGLPSSLKIEDASKSMELVKAMTEKYRDKVINMFHEINDWKNKYQESKTEEERALIDKKIEDLENEWKKVNSVLNGMENHIPNDINEEQLN